MNPFVLGAALQRRWKCCVCGTFMAGQKSRCGVWTKWDEGLGAHTEAITFRCFYNTFGPL